MSKRVLVAVLAIVSLFGLFSAFAQSAALSGEPLLRALLDEMRAIRLAMQTNSAQELRGRLLIERIKMQQEVVRELSREIEQTPNAAISAETDHFAEMEEDIERRVRAETEPERKRMIEREKERIKRRREMETVHREQARVRLQRMENRLVEEREKLRLLEEELNRLLREMGSPASANR